MKQTLMNHTATIIGLLGLVGILVAAALFLSTDEVGAQRFALIVGLVSIGVQVLAGNLRTDTAVVKTEEGNEVVAKAIEEAQPVTTASLQALTEMLARTERTVERVEHAAETVANGNSGS